MKRNVWLFTSLFVLALSCSNDGKANNDDCPDMLTPEECLVANSGSNANTGDAGNNNATNSGGDDMSSRDGGGGSDAGTNGTNTTNNSTGSSWWFEVTGALPVPRIEGSIVANALTPGVGSLGGGDVSDESSFVAAVNLAGAGPGDYAISSLTLVTAAEEYSCRGTDSTTLTVNVLEPLDADFSGTLYCNPGPDIDTDTWSEHTITGHVQE